MDVLTTHLPKALDVFLAHRRSDNGIVYNALIQAGMDAETALVFFYFVPIAFARLALKSSGIEFHDSFLCLVGEENAGPFSFSADPRYALLIEGIPGLVAEWERDDVLTIAGRSSEFSAINKAAHSSSALKDIRLTETVFVNPSAQFVSACVPYKAS